MNSREEWFRATLPALDEWFRERGGTALPLNVRVGIGFPSTGATATRNRSTGECWATECSADGFFEIFVSPVHEPDAEMFGTFVHELVHAAVGLECDHRGPFRRLALAVGLEGKMTATTTGPELHELFDRLVEELGPIPHAALKPRPRRKQSTRMLKATCSDCEMIIRTSRKWAETKSFEELSCGCGGIFTLS